MGPTRLVSVLYGTVAHMYCTIYSTAGLSCHGHNNLLQQQADQPVTASAAHFTEAYTNTTIPVMVGFNIQCGWMLEMGNSEATTGNKKIS